MSLKSEGKNFGRFDRALMMYAKRESKLSGKRVTCCDVCAKGADLQMNGADLARLGRYFGGFSCRVYQESQRPHNHKSIFLSR